MINIKWSSEFSDNSIQSKLCSGSEVELCDYTAKTARELCNLNSNCTVAQTIEPTGEVARISFYTWECAEAGLRAELVTDGTSSLETKVNAENAEDRWGCLNNEVLTFHGDKCPVNGAAATSNYYRQPNGLWLSDDVNQLCRIRWSTTDCGYVVSVDGAPDAPTEQPWYCTEETEFYPTCRNDVVHWIFGQQWPNDDSNNDGTADVAAFIDFLAADYDMNNIPDVDDTALEFCTN